MPKETIISYADDIIPDDDKLLTAPYKMKTYLEHLANSLDGY